MPQIGIRDLKTHASEILRQVRDQRTRYIITYRGQPVGVLLPLPETDVEAQLLSEAPAGDPWDELTALGQEIGAGWPSDQSSTEILSNMRR
ncbi:MAG TPA: type II toxin-antitoxin system Phd/YefM family antitoxin [Anaerolineae bacterium]|nr:type II toxin-antitoxin system Phd/YefM family antitoxin [Anaerolineae bacterium]HMR68586.1 type II toxin-antitoxin system Phd/YefM family antitoxin [Anaerolineae bacterium]